jgi:molybdate transport system permease protein
MKLRPLLAAACVLCAAAAAPAETITVAAAADLKPAMDELVAAFRATHPGDEVEVVYGSSGRFHAQIQQGAPYDLYFSADIALPRSLAAAGFAALPVTPYARGRIALWSASLDASRMTLASLADPAIARVAIANPRHAPYGQRAVEALRAAGVWEEVQPKLVFGENIAQAAQFVETGNADVGILALSLALSPQLAGRGSHWLIPESLHEPLDQGFVLTRRAEGNALAHRFADFAIGTTARSVMSRYGFELPGALHRGQAPAAPNAWLSTADLVALGLTARLAATVTLILLVVGTPLAWWLARTRSGWRGPLGALVAMPLVLPPSVLGFYLLLAMGPEGPAGRLTQSLGLGLLPFTFWGLVVASVFYSLPFMVQPLQTAFEAIGDRPLEVAATLRASPLDAFFTVAVPLALPGFVTAAILTFAHTVGEFGVVLMIGGNLPGVTRVASVKIFDHVEALEYGQAHHLAAVMLVFSFLVLLVVYSSRSRSRRASL